MSGNLANQRRQSVRLQRVEAYPRIGESLADPEGIGPQSVQVVEIEGSAKPASRVDCSGRNLGRQMPGTTFRVRASAVETMLSTIDVPNAAIRTSASIEPGGQPPSVNP